MDTAEQLKKALYKKISEIENLIESNMEKKGDTTADCQKMMLTMRLKDFEYAVNGLEDGDMKSV